VRERTVTARIAVVGLGLMGGSLLRRLADLGAPVTGWSPDGGERDAARGVSGASTVDRLDDALRGADGIVLATPLLAMPDLLDPIRNSAPPGAWVTDVGSLQEPPLAWAASHGLGDRFLTSHPMAGGEASGFAASRVDLYDGARVWLSGGGAADAALEVRLERFWTGLGAHPTSIEAAAHDRLMARVSHLPQVVSTHLAGVLADEGIAAHTLGPGARDMTRLAGSDPRMWEDILTLGGATLPATLRALARRLEGEALRLEAGNAERFAELLGRTRAWREG